MPASDRVVAARYHLLAHSCPAPSLGDERRRCRQAHRGGSASALPPACSPPYRDSSGSAIVGSPGEGGSISVQEMGE
ncbi:hypothetical protein KSP40_PGU007862 [Platanthera guangdongensis]|uniref:Uncharacterized protein n=1 Tax=Platanthera guangdongensis TaxID=2320717 RepID=A0ABR2MPF8_9ASPA